uniref:N-acetyltransferase domain-containing protein n=2 Tax=Dunaliella tertiolecta TaxID=3047 RepID=A0A6S8HWL5_DUNTE
MLCKRLNSDCLSPRGPHCSGSRACRVKSIQAQSKDIAIGLARPGDYFYCADLHVRVFHEEKKAMASKLDLCAQVRSVLSRIDRILSLTTNDGLQSQGVGRTALLVAHQRERSGSSQSPGNSIADKAERAFLEAISGPVPLITGSQDSSSPHFSKILADQVSRNVSGSSSSSSSSRRLANISTEVGSSTNRGGAASTTNHGGMLQGANDGGAPMNNNNGSAYSNSSSCLKFVDPWVLQAAVFLVPPAARGGMGQCAESCNSVAVANLDSFGDLIPPKTLSPSRDGAFGWYKRPGVAYLSNVAVLPVARRQGVARRIVEAAEKLAASWGCTSIGLHCSPQNTAAVQLYKGLGYKPTKALENPLLPYLNGRAPDRCQLFLKRIPTRLRKDVSSKISGSSN